MEEYESINDRHIEEGIRGDVIRLRGGALLPGQSRLPPWDPQGKNPLQVAKRMHDMYYSLDYRRERKRRKLNKIGAGAALVGLAAARWKRKKPDGTYDEGEGPILKKYKGMGIANVPQDQSPNSRYYGLTSMRRRLKQIDKEQVFFNYQTLNLSPCANLTTSTSGIFLSPRAAGLMPPLWWGYDVGGTSPTFLQLLSSDIVSGYETLDIYGSPTRSGNIHIQVADWIGVGLSHDNMFATDAGVAHAAMQSSYISTYSTDPNSPIQMSAVWANKDWTKLQCMGFKYEFDFTNWAPYEYTVEILFFKPIADPHSMTHGQMAEIVNNNEKDYELYCNKACYNLGSKSYRTIKRMRFRVPGLTNQIGGATSATDATPKQGLVVNPFQRNTFSCKYFLKSKQEINRPVTNVDISGFTDADAFRKFYLMEKGKFMRIQAWPTRPHVTLPAEANASQISTVPRIDDWYYQRVKTCTQNQLLPCLGVTIDRKAYFKLDKPIFKGPHRS